MVIDANTQNDGSMTGGGGGGGVNFFFKNQLTKFFLGLKLWLRKPPPTT